MSIHTAREEFIQSSYSHRAGQGLLGKPPCPDFMGSSAVELLEPITSSCFLNPAPSPIGDAAVHCMGTARFALEAKDGDGWCLEPQDFDLISSIIIQTMDTEGWVSLEKGQDITVEKK